VLFNFERKVRLDIAPVEDKDTGNGKDKDNKNMKSTCVLTEESLLELCISCGVDDYDPHFVANGLPCAPRQDGAVAVFIKPEDMTALKVGLVDCGYRVSALIQHVPSATAGYITLDDDDFEGNMAAVDALLTLDDVDSVEHNIYIDPQD
jgi:transcriptional/translational regulatory protein YebC/TACO1